VVVLSWLTKIPEVQKAVHQLKVLILRRSRQLKEYELETNVDLEVCEQTVVLENEELLAGSA
jgi:hypothetical protein